MHTRFAKIFPATVIISILVVIYGFVLDGPVNVLHGIYLIVSEQDLLITDYVEIAGLGAALVNCGLVTLISICIIKLSGDAFNGYTIMEMGLMAGFSLFGKNIFNIWPIILGSWLYARYRREPFSKYSSVALLSTSLAPFVSYMALGSNFASMPLGLLTGVFIGFVLPALSPYTYRVQNGMSLYNVGFASGLLAMMMVPILTAMGDNPDTVLFWSAGYNLYLSFMLFVLCIASITAGFFACGTPGWAVMAGYRRLLSTTGRAPSDYLRMFGSGPVLVNIGVNGLIGMAYILLTGGDLNGPTVGGILTIMGFSATGKHARNIWPVMLGVAIGGLLLPFDINAPAVQLAGLFVTTLAPIAGHFGWPFGIAAGFIHSALVLQTSGPVSGLNLYNNGFSGGLIAIVFYPVITSIFRRHRPIIKNDSFFEQFDNDQPIDVYEWRTRRRDAKNKAFSNMPDGFGVLSSEELTPEKEPAACEEVSPDAESASVSGK